MRFDDFLMRAIQQLTQAVARILRLTREGEVEEAQRELDGAYDQLLGPDRVFLDMVDGATLGNLLGTPEKARVLAKLSMLEAGLAARRGDAGRAARLRDRANTLRDHAHDEDPRDDDATLLDDLS